MSSDVSFSINDSETEPLIHHRDEEAETEPLVGRRQQLFKVIIAIVVILLTLSVIIAWVIPLLAGQTFSWRKAAVSLTYVGLGLAHAIEGTIALPTRMFSNRSQMNYQASKIAFYSLWAFTRPITSPYYSRFDFHHLSYGLLFTLGVGRAERFGKWIVFDSCVDYNQLGVFNRTHHFIETSPGMFKFVLGETDGTLNEVGMQDDLKVFPADDCFEDHLSEFFKEIFFLKEATMLNKATERTNYLVDNLVKPYIANLIKNPNEPQLKISIDFDLFKS